MTLTPLQTASTHEAGHAVVAALEGHRVTFANVLRLHSSIGLIGVTPPPESSGQAGAAILVAGDVAVAMATSGRWSAPNAPAGRWFYGQDVYRERPAPDVPDDDRRAHAIVRGSAAGRQAAELRAHRHLASRWRVVVAIADALLEQGELEERELHALLADLRPVRNESGRTRVVLGQDVSLRAGCLPCGMGHAFPGTAAPPPRLQWPILNPS